ncbi:hypothetical protein [Azotosporobacter soli]
MKKRRAEQAGRFSLPKRMDLSLQAGFAACLQNYSYHYAVKR